MIGDYLHMYYADMHHSASFKWQQSTAAESSTRGRLCSDYNQYSYCLMLELTPHVCSVVSMIEDYLLARDGLIGGLTARFHGVPTEYSQRKTLEVDAPEIHARLLQDGADAVLLSAL